MAGSAAGRGDWHDGVVVEHRDFARGFAHSVGRTAARNGTRDGCQVDSCGFRRAGSTRNSYLDTGNGFVRAVVPRANSGYASRPMRGSSSEDSREVGGRISYFTYNNSI